MPSSFSRPTTPFYDAKVTVLSEPIKHHAHEGETPGTEMFAQCCKSDVDLVALLEPMPERKRGLMARARATGLPAAEPGAVKLVTN